MSEAVTEGGSEKPSGWRGAIRGNVLAVSLVSLFTDFSSEMMLPLLPAFIAGLVAAVHAGLSEEQILAIAAVYVGTMGGLADATASLLKLVSGRISDKLGKRKALIAVGYGISTVARPLMGLAAAAWNVVALRMCDRVGKGIRTAPRDALISDAVGPDARGLAFGFHRAMDHAGAILGPLVAVVILYAFLHELLWRTGKKVPTGQEMYALRWLFGIALIPGLLAMGMIFGKVREIAPKPAPAGGEKKQGWRALPRKFYAYVGIVGLFSLGNSTDLFWLLFAERFFGFGLLQIIAVWVVLHISKMVFSIPGGILSDKLGRRPVIVVGWTMYALVYLGMAAVGVYGVQWAFWALIAAYGFYYGMSEGVEKALVADFVPSEQRGTGFGVYHAAEGLAKLPASLMFGVFWAVIGPVWAFGIGASLAGAAVVLLTILLSATHRPVPQE